MKKTNSILDDIVKRKKESLITLKKEIPLSNIISKLKYSNNKKIDFKKAITKNNFSIIAEIKKASPSAGIINNDFNHIKIAQIYEKVDIDAISIITEEYYFKGNIKFMSDIKKFTTKPILRKDFIFDEYQIYESKLHGADAILLITSILEKNEIIKLAKLAKKLELDVLLETHTKEEIKLALECNAEIIGINNRNLKTFKVDLANFINLSKHIPSDKIIICESGIKTKRDIQKVKSSGANSVLIGTSLMKSKNIESKIEELKT